MSTNGTPGSSSAVPQDDDEMVDATMETQNQAADTVHIPPLTGVNNNAERSLVIFRSIEKSDEMSDLTGALNQLQTSDKLNPSPGPETQTNQTPHTFSNPRPDTPFPTDTTHVVANGWYNLSDYVDSDTIRSVLRNIPTLVFHFFVKQLVGSGNLDMNDHLCIGAETRVMITALMYQQLVSPARLKLPSDVIKRLVPLVRQSWFCEPRE